MVLQRYAFLLFLRTYITSSSTQHNCWDIPLFSTKTPYKLVSEYTSVKTEKPGNSCKPIQINMVHRHGNRYPSTKDIRNMVAMSKEINKASGSISTKIPLKLPWKCPFIEAQNKLLSTVGEKELYNIGKNIQFNFPELFTRMYSPLLYKFQSTCKLRCTHSSSALAAGVFQHLGSIGDYKFQPIAINTSACDDDPILRFFENCQKYVKEVSENDSTLQEMDKFDQGPEMKKVLEKVILRLNTNKTNLNVQHLKAIFIACSYDLGMFHESSGICSLFDEDDRSVVEYSLDLKHFYKRSAGYKITYESSCPLLRDIINTLTLAAANTSESYIGVFRSAHAETLIPLYALLGIYLDDVHPTSTNYHKLKKRLFRPACISPFSGNMYFILYNCGDDGLKIQLYVNERLTKIPCCSSKVDCRFEVFLKYYEKYVNQCNFEEMCKLPQLPHEEL